MDDDVEWQYCVTHRAIHASTFRELIYNTASTMSDAQKPMTDSAVPGAPTAAEPKGPSLLDLPPEVLLHGLLPILPLRDLIAISQVDKELHALAVRDLKLPLN